MALGNFLVASILTLTAALSRSSPRWHFARISQRARLTRAQRTFGSNELPFRVRGANAPVAIYVIDSGLRASHEEFAGRAVIGPDLVHDGLPRGSDCQGHGTSVAALAAGRYSGIARSATLVSVRILDCVGSGHCTDVVRALRWVRRDATKRRPARAVVVMALGSRDIRCQGTNSMTERMAQEGIVIVAASGNSRNDSCAVFPASNEHTISVASTDRYDRLYKKNNFGECIDIAAPGVGVVSAWGNKSDTEYRHVSGTSMATPLVGGVAATILSADPTLSVRQVREILLTGATTGAVRDAKGRPAKNVVNRLLYAPWAKLFDDVPRDGSPPRLSAEPDTRWYMALVDFRPRVQPAMLHAAHTLQNAIIRNAGTHARVADVVVRRATHVQRLRNGSEPRTVRLHVYVRRGAVRVGVLNAAVRAGNVTRIVGEQMRFVEITGTRNFLRGVAGIPGAVYERAKPPKIEVDGATALLLALLAWMLTMVAIVVGTAFWKNKCCGKRRKPSGAPTGDDVDEAPDVVAICATDGITGHPSAVSETRRAEDRSRTEADIGGGD